MALMAQDSKSASWRRFLLNTTVETETNLPLTVLVNWTAGVKK